MTAGADSSTPLLFAAPDITDADIAAVTDVLRSGWLTTGSVVLDLEARLRDYLDIPEVIAVSSCTAALEIAVAYLGLPRGAKVGVPTWTFVSSALAPVHHGLDVVLLDVDPNTLNISPDSLEAALAEGLDVVVGVHYGGVAFDPKIRALCAAANVPLIEDAAHALGTVDDRGRVAGQSTAGACFSFYATKNLTSAEGGAIATDNTDFADFARSFRLHGMSRDAWARYRPGERASYDLVYPGVKANMPDLLAALAVSQLDRYDAMQAARRARVSHYRELLADTPVTFVPGAQSETSADHLCVVVLPEGTDRDRVVAAMSDVGVSTSVHFRPLHRFSWFAKNATIGPSGIDVAERVADRALSLPLFSSMTPQDVERASAALVDAVGK